MLFEKPGVDGVAPKGIGGVRGPKLATYLYPISDPRREPRIESALCPANPPVLQAKNRFSISDLWN